MLFSINKNEWVGNLRNDFFAGLVSSIAILPEVVGFAIIAGVNPMVALLASATTILVISFTGGRPAMVSAAAGSMALVMATLIKNHGIEYMIAATILTGVLQLLLGYLGIQKLMKFIPKTVMFGFVNALAILIFLAQVQQLPGQSLPTYAMVITSIGLMYLLPKITRVVPPALIVIIVMTIISLFFSKYLKNIGDLGSISPLQVSISFPDIPFNLNTLTIIFPSAIALTFVGLIESLLTIPIVDSLTETSGDSKREVKAQGLANIITGILGGPAGCAMIGQAVINVKSGGRKRFSTFAAGISLLMLIFFMKNIMLQIPTAALIGIMITVSFETFEWESLSLIKTFEVTESFIMVITVGTIVYTHNLATGIFIGVLISSVVFMVKSSSISVVSVNNIFAVTGPLFFASTHTFSEHFNKIQNSQELLTIDFTQCRILDYSGTTAVQQVIKKLHDQGKSISITGLEKHNPKFNYDVQKIISELNKY